jgi:hypothetical protein
MPEEAPQPPTQRAVAAEQGAEPSALAPLPVRTEGARA